MSNADHASSSPSGQTLQAIPRSVWALGFVSMFMDPLRRGHPRRGGPVARRHRPLTELGQRALGRLLLEQRPAALAIDFQPVGVERGQCAAVADAHQQGVGHFVAQQ